MADFAVPQPPKKGVPSKRVPAALEDDAQPPLKRKDTPIPTDLKNSIQVCACAMCVV